MLQSNLRVSNLKNHNQDIIKACCFFFFSLAGSPVWSPTGRVSYGGRQPSSGSGVAKCEKGSVTKLTRALRALLTPTATHAASLEAASATERALAAAAAALERAFPPAASAPSEVGNKSEVDSKSGASSAFSAAAPRASPAAAAAAAPPAPGSGLGTNLGIDLGTGLGVEDAAWLRVLATPQLVDLLLGAWRAAVLTTVHQAVDEEAGRESIEEEAGRESIRGGGGGESEVRLDALVRRGLAVCLGCLHLTRSAPERPGTDLAAAPAPAPADSASPSAAPAPGVCGAGSGTGPGGRVTPWDFALLHLAHFAETAPPRAVVLAAADPATERILAELAEPWPPHSPAPPKATKAGRAAPGRAPEARWAAAEAGGPRPFVSGVETGAIY